MAKITYVDMVDKPAPPKRVEPLLVPSEPKRKRGRPPNGFDRTAYQREYMRKRSAKARQIAEKA